MKLKHLICGFAAMGIITAAVADSDFGTEILDGGKIVPVKLQMLKSIKEHLNFCFAKNYEDGTIYLNHSEGIHTVTERGNRMYSTDNGETWQVTPFNFGGFNGFLNKKGEKCQITGWTSEEKDLHMIQLTILNSDGKSVRTKKLPLKLPFVSTLRMHRKVIRTQDDRLLLPVHCWVKGAPKRSVFLIESKDDGESWQYLSTIMDDPEGKYAEGPNEADVVELANGDLLAYVRTGAPSPMFQLRSKDGGKTWGDKIKFADTGVAPEAKILSNGTLLVITGRPGVYLYVDYTGTGTKYQKYQVWGGSGSSYSSILEIAPNRVMVIYDESDFGAWRNQSRFSRIMAATFDIIKDDSLKAPAIKHPKAKNYKNFYSAECMQPLLYRNLFIGHGMLNKAQGEKHGTYWEVREIAERPQPVLHMSFKGEKPPFKFAHCYKNIDDDNCSFAEAGWEVRVNENVKSPQFRVVLTLKGYGQAFVGCGREALMIQDEGKLKTVPFDAGTKFNDFDLKADGKKGTFVLYVNGKEFYSGKLTKVSSTAGTKIHVGDGSNQVYGSCDLTYLGFTFK